MMNTYRRPQRVANSKQELRSNGINPGERQLQCLHLRTEADGGGVRIEEERQLGQSADPSHHCESPFRRKCIFFIYHLSQLHGTEQEGQRVGYFRARIRKDNYKLEVDVERMVKQNW